MKLIKKKSLLFPLIIIAASTLLYCSHKLSTASAQPVLEGFPWPDPANETVLEVPAGGEAILVDGSPDEAGWKDCAAIEKFYRTADAGQASVDAAVGVIYDGGNLVFRIDLPPVEAEGSLRKCFLSDEFDLARSKASVSIFLDPFHGHGVYYRFIVDPGGNKQDLRVADESWAADWQAAVDHSSGRWSAEIAIPVAQLFGPPAAGDIWGFNVALNGVNDEGTLSSTPIRLNFVDAERFGHLLFEGNLNEDSLAKIKAGLPVVHRNAREAGLEANRKLCGPELVDIPGELADMAPGREFLLKGAGKITCLGLDNPEIVRSRYPFFYERYDNPEIQRLREEFDLDAIIAPGKNEFEQLILLNEWLVENVPFGSPPPIRPQPFHVLKHGLAGQTFNCTYKSFTLVQLYTALGWTARKITSVGHGTLDVWSDYWRKWVQIDPSRNSYFRLSGTAVPLNSNEIRRQFWRNGGVDMEMVFGSGQRAERVTLERREKDGLMRYRQDGYAWVAYKTRNNFLEIPYAYRNFLYLMVEDEYNRGKQWIHMYSGKPDERQLFSIQTDRPGDIFWTLNQAYVHLYDQGGSALRVQLETVTPNFEAFEISVDNGEWRRSEPVFTWNLHPGQNFLQARSINKFGRRGAEHKVVLGMGEE